MGGLSRGFQKISGITEKVLGSDIAEVVEIGSDPADLFGLQASRAAKTAATQRDAAALASREEYIKTQTAKKRSQGLQI